MKRYRDNLSFELKTALIIFAVAMLNPMISRWDYLIRNSICGFAKMVLIARANPYLLEFRFGVTALGRC